MAALSAVRRAPHEGQNPWRLPKSAHQLLVCAVSRAAHAEIRRQNAAFEKGLKRALDELRHAGAGPGLKLREERLEMFPHQAMQDRLLRPPPLAMDRVRWRGAQYGVALQFHPEARARTTIARHLDSAEDAGGEPRPTTGTARALKKGYSAAPVVINGLDRSASAHQSAKESATPTQSSTASVSRCWT